MRVYGLSDRLCDLFKSIKGSEDENEFDSDDESDSDEESCMILQAFHRIKLKTSVILILGITCLYLNMVLLSDLPKSKLYYQGMVASSDIEWPLCPFYCNGINCMNPKCIHCEYTCTTRCLETSQPYPKSDTKCPSVTFRDVTKQTLELEYFKNYPQMGRPKNSEYSPLFVDVNGDGLLDVFDFSHQEIKEVLESIYHGNVTTLRPAEGRVILDMDASKSDAHGINVIDLDGDGILDIYISVGGGRGGIDALADKRTRNILLWGEFDQQNNIVFRGSQDAAEKAGIAMQLSRGRMNYILDVNNDGLYDIFCGTDRRMTNDITPGILLINNGNRTWHQDTSIMEYSKVMILTDVDGDGYANEFVINRDFCYPMRQGPGIDPHFPEYGPYPDDILQFCSTRPASTTAVYKYNTNKMINIAKNYKNISAYRGKQPPCCPHGSYYTHCCAQSLASADFDDDLLADQVMLYNKKVKFFYSSDRPKGVLPFAHQYVSHTLYIPEECWPRAVRVVDIDNDGVQELMIMCRDTSQILFYSRVSHNIRDGWVLNVDCPFGDLHRLPQLAHVTTDDYKTACRIQHNFTITNFVCKEYRDKRQKKFALEAMSIVDINNDGYLDIVVTYALGHIVFLYNTPLALNRFIVFKLKGKLNLHGIGATLILYSKGMTDSKGITTQFREVSSYQHASDNQGYVDDRIIFGLGEKGVPTKVLVRWPNGLNQNYALDDWVYSPKLSVVELVER